MGSTRRLKHSAKIEALGRGVGLMLVEIDCASKEVRSSAVLLVLFVLVFRLGAVMRVGDMEIR